MVAQARTWDLITEATTVESFRYLRENLDAIGQASYACELVDAFSDSGDENRPLWELALFVLRELDEAAAGGDARQAVHSSAGTNCRQTCCAGLICTC